MSIVKFKTASGDEVQVLVTPVADATGPRQGGNLQNVVKEAEKTLDEALRVVGPLADAFLGQLAQLRETANAPSEVSLEFGLQLNAEAGALLAKAGAEAHVQVTLTWSDEPKK